jgi:hypothetical protein
MSNEVARSRSLLRSFSEQNTLGDLGFLRLFGGVADVSLRPDELLVTHAASDANVILTADPFRASR